MTRISFLLPTFNRAAYIAESIHAVRAQMGPADELLVIDDGSTDDTPAIVAGIVGVGYVRQDNAGKSVALNRGMARTDGEFVMICDDDDVLRPDTVAPLLATLETRNAGFAFGRYSRFTTDASGKWNDLGTGYWPDLGSGSLVRHILEDAFVMQNAALVRRSAYEKVGPFDETMLRSLDYEMFVRLALAVPAAYLDRYIFDQRKHEGARGPASALHAASASDQVWREWDRRIFGTLHARLPIQGYEGLLEGSEPLVLRRAALLQRACINARHDLWEGAVDDLEAAAAAAQGTPLTAVEVEIAGRILNGKHGFPGAFAPEILPRLKALATQREIGRQVVEAMIAGALWQLKSRVPGEAAALRRLTTDLVGPARTAWLLVRRKLGLGKPSAGSVCERNAALLPDAG
ncbi:glycosyltransferase family 2 protein [Sphingomonas gei]|uniref:Glycosyltransferase family 2 protein n=1 Tax=Sphingomonas gei TaxID=1395960 RepID=A0A4S1XAY9_9SPHN|nr:glycosyltransferase family 2 protein [Sphingomonas gei]TGX53494.1 glycosyltransferase family 2 protein [Sphingomonas gei]